MWFWYAICASILWGVSYVINQLLMKSFNAFEVLMFESAIILIIFIPFFLVTGQMKITVMKLFDVKMILLVIAGSVIYTAAAICILKSIGGSNASLAAIIEASYPIFTMIFAYILLSEVQFSFLSVLGCILVIAGLIVVQYGNS